MITPQFFYNILKTNNTLFFTGVPDSLLKNFCAYLTDTAEQKNHIIAANEGNAIALAAGHYLAKGTIPLVYMQNSGIGNTVNPLLSLADKEVYSTPMLLMIGWRGEPEVHDEPQHIKQGRVTTALLEEMEIPYCILDTDESAAEKQIETAYQTMKDTQAPYAIVIRKGTFSSYTLKNNEEVPGTMSRESAIETIIQNVPAQSAFVSTTGKASRELYELRNKYNQGHAADFLTVGSMGHASQIALGIALEKPEKKIFCLDGDGAAIMHMGAMAVIGTQKPENLVHIVLNNGAHDSVGGQPTIGRQIDLCAIAKACGYDETLSVSTAEELKKAVIQTADTKKTVFIEIIVTKGAREDLGRPAEAPCENKAAFMKYLGE